MVPEMNAPKVSIIVLNYNGKRFLDDCFQSLAKVDYPNFEVVMVDNESMDESVPYVSKNYKWVRVFRSGSNNGFAFGNNVGIKNTDGEYIFLLNNDTVCTPDFLNKVVQVAESDPEVGIVGAVPIQLNLDISQSKIVVPWEKDADRVASVAGAVMLIKRDILRDIGLLDETYFLYWEDTEFCWRANLLGYKIMVANKSIVFHIENATGLPTKNKWVYQYIRNKIYTHIKLTGFSYILWVLFIEIIYSLGRIFLHPQFTFSIINAWLWNFTNLKSTLKKRKEIRSRKKMDDRELIKLIAEHNKRDKIGREFFKKLENTFAEKKSYNQ